MTNVWKYAEAERIRITDIDGDMFEGKVTDVTDREERSDLEKQEDGITLWTDDNKLIEFYQSEIKLIEVLPSQTGGKTGRAAV